MNQINTGIISFSVVTANNALFAFAINIITALFILDNTAFGVFSFWEEFGFAEREERTKKEVQEVTAKSRQIWEFGRDRK